MRTIFFVAMLALTGLVFASNASAGEKQDAPAPVAEAQADAPSSCKSGACAGPVARAAYAPVRFFKTHKPVRRASKRVLCVGKRTIHFAACGVARTAEVVVVQPIKNARARACARRAARSSGCN